MIINQAHPKTRIRLRKNTARMLAHYEDNRWSIVDGNRQTGKTHASIQYILDHMIIHEGANVVLTSCNLSNAHRVLVRMEQMIKDLNIMEFGYDIIVNQNTIQIGRSIVTVHAVTSPPKGQTISLLVLDEVAYCKEADIREYVEGIVPTMMSSKVIIATSVDDDITGPASQYIKELYNNSNWATLKIA